VLGIDVGVALGTRVELGEVALVVGVALGVGGGLVGVMLLGRVALDVGELIADAVEV